MADSHLLSEVSLRHFKAAYHPDSIELRPFNVIIGRNGSGKSTLLEALQWIDTTLRRDAREASDRYQGSRDLVNLRVREEGGSFTLTLKWRTNGDDHGRFRYAVEVKDDLGIARVISEELVELNRRGRAIKRFVTTENGGRALETGAQRIPLNESDRLVLGLVENLTAPGAPRFLSDFWKRAVFLRLSPNRLREGSPATRRSFEPLLDEEGQNLPALLNELDDEQREGLTHELASILPGIQGVEVSKAEIGRDTRVHYSLQEHMPYVGRAGKKKFSIPAWMLSEGTRRITAILALLMRDPPPTLLCIEELENGLDPWTVRAVLKRLRDAAANGTQVLLTTHSPWVLDDVPVDSIIVVRRLKGDTQYQRFATMPEVQAFKPSIPAGTRYTNLEDKVLRGT